MLLFGSRLIGTPVMSLQTGARLAQVKTPIIDPADLKIIAYEVDGPLLHERPAFLRTNDIREMGRLGMIVDDSDELVGLDDVIQIEKLYKLGFPLIGMPVIDEQKYKLGKVENYTLETDGFVIQQLHIRRGLLRSLSDTGILVHRSQIVEINDDNIIVKSTAKKISAPVAEPVVQLDYVNPFRKPTSQPQPES